MVATDGGRTASRTSDSSAAPVAERPWPRAMAASNEAECEARVHVGIGAGELHGVGDVAREEGAHFAFARVVFGFVVLD
jgi:hypothetical protein